MITRRSTSCAIAVAIALGPALPVAAEPGSGESLKILANPLLPQASVGKAYSFQFRSSGSGQVTWSLFSPVPGRSDWDGWDLEPGGRLSGKPVGADCDASGAGCPDGWTCGPAKRCEGLISFDVSAANLKGQYEQRLFDLVITDPANPLEVGSLPTLPPGAVGQPYRGQFYARGGLAPFRWKASGSLPPGLSLGSDGAISGTPTGRGSFAWTVEVSDSSSKTARKRIKLRIDDLSQPVAFAPNPKVMLQPKTPRIGLNVSDSFTYYDDAHLYNQYISNPGMEPNPPVRKMYWAWAGTANSLEEHYYAQFQELGELNSGFWDGGHYWILSGPAKGREGTIVKYERVPDKTVEGGFRAVWTLADSAPSRLPRKTPAQEMDKDIFMVESAPANKTDPQNYKGTLPPGWWAVADESATFSVDKVNRAGGSQSAKVVSGQDVKVGFLSALVTDNPWRRLRSDTTYEFSLDVRQSGVGNRAVSVELLELGSSPPFFSKSFEIPDDGKFHHVKGQFVGKPSFAMVNFQVVIEQKGTLWVDNVLLYESMATATPANGARQAQIAARPFAPLPFVVDDLKKLKVGGLRFWYFGSGVSLQEALRISTPGNPSPSLSMYTDLSLAELVGADAWIITAKEWLPFEFAQLAEYLSSKDITKGLGKLRAEQGHPLPWTETIGHIYLEYCDEAWNWPDFAYPFDMWHPEKYSSFTKERFNAFRGSKYYSGKVTLVVNGQANDDFWVNDPIDKLTYPAHDAMDIAPYVDTQFSLPLTDLSANVLSQVIGHTKGMRDTMKVWSSRGEKTRMLIYEGGPGASTHRPSAGEEVRQNSMTLASLSLDSIADLLANGAEAYMFFGYQSNAAWQATTGSTSRFHLPTWYAISMFNSACADKSLVQTKFPAEVPTLTTVARDQDGNRIDGEAVPAISVRSYIGKGQKSFLAINRSPLVSYPVVLKTADNAVSYRIATLATDGAERGALEGPGLVPSESSPRDLSKIFEVAQPTVRELKSADGGIRITLPPASVITVEQMP